jgi:hypothetical protein
MLRCAKRIGSTKLALRAQTVVGLRPDILPADFEIGRLHRL